MFGEYVFTYKLDYYIVYAPPTFSFAPRKQWTTRGGGGGDTPFNPPPPPPGIVKRRGGRHSYDGPRARLRAAKDNLLTNLLQQWLERVEAELPAHRAAGENLQHAGVGFTLGRGTRT